MLKIHRKQNPDRLMLTVPNGDEAGDPLRHGVQWYQLDGPESKLVPDREADEFHAAEPAPTGRERFLAETAPRSKLYAIGHGISGATMDRWSDEDVARIVAAWAEFAGVAPAAVGA